MFVVFLSGGVMCCCFVCVLFMTFVCVCVCLMCVLRFCLFGVVVFFC